MRAARISVAIQAAGSAATFATGAIVASCLGLAAQGEFALLKSWSDGFIAAATFGMPQALLHIQYREGVDTGSLMRFVKHYVAGVVGLTALLVSILWSMQSTGHGLASTTLRFPQLVVLAAGVPLATGHALLRSLTLKQNLLRFSMLTAMPSALVLLNLLVAIGLGWRPGFEWVLTGSALFSLLAARIAVENRGPQSVHPTNVTSWSTRQLWSISLQTGTQNVIAAFLPALLLGLARLRGATLHDLGRVSLGLYIYQAFAVLATYAGPLIYDAAARKERQSVFYNLRSHQGMILRLVMAAVVSAGIVPVTLTFFGHAGASFAWTIALNAAAGACALLVRTLWSVMQAQGAFGLLSKQALVRLAVSLPVLLALMIWLPATLAVPLVLLLGEVSLVAWFILLINSETLSFSKHRSIQ